MRDRLLSISSKHNQIFEGTEDIEDLLVLVDSSVMHSRKVVLVLISKFDCAVDEYGPHQGDLQNLLLKYLILNDLIDLIHCFGFAFDATLDDVVHVHIRINILVLITVQDCKLHVLQDVLLNSVVVNVTTRSSCEADAGVGSDGQEKLFGHCKDEFITFIEDEHVLGVGSGG